MTPRIVVVHWDCADLQDKVAKVHAAGGHVVGQECTEGRRAHDAARDLDPDLLVVWLQAKPSHGRVTAAAIRGAPWGRRLPILFVTDDPDPVPAATLHRVKTAVPDAIVDRADRLRFWIDRIAALSNNP